MPLPMIERHTQRHQIISQRAFEIWLEEGKPEGRDKEHWHQAEQEIYGGIDTRVRIMPSYYRPGPYGVPVR